MRPSIAREPARWSTPVTESEISCEERRLASVGHAEARVEQAELVSDRLGRNLEGAGDLIVGASAGEVLEELPVTGGEAERSQRVGVWCGAIAHQLGEVRARWNSDAVASLSR